jgi:hypothetical protein
MGLLTRVFFLKLQSCHFWGALSDERSGLSCVSLVIEVYSKELTNLSHWALYTLFDLPDFICTERNSGSCFNSLEQNVGNLICFCLILL